MVSGGGKRIKDRRRGDALSAFPASRLLVWHSSFDHKRSRHADVVRGHAFNQQLEIVMPTRAATELAESLKWETSFYYEVTTSIAMFLSPRFINEYIKEGSLYMIAKNVAVDGHNTAMLLPCGELLLLVDNETYEQLGLVGHKYAQHIPAETQSAKQHYTSRRAHRYVVRIDLKSELFASQEPNTQRDRVLQCLASKFEPLEMLICAYNSRGAPRTIIFGDDDTIERKRIEINGSLDTLADIFVPALHQFYPEKTPDTQDLKPAMMEMELMRSSLEGVYDWLGVVACRLTDLLQQKPLEEYVSSFQGVPATEGMTLEEQSQVSVVTWRGLIAAEFTERALDRVREQVHSGKIPWAAVTVWGFQDALVSWQQTYHVPLSRTQQKKARKQTKMAEAGGVDVEMRETETAAEIETETREHGFLVNGNNNYTFLVLPQHEYFVLQELGPHDATM